MPIAIFHLWIKKDKGVKARGLCLGYPSGLGIKSQSKSLGLADNGLGGFTERSMSRFGPVDLRCNILSTLGFHNSHAFIAAFEFREIT